MQDVFPLAENMRKPMFLRVTFRRKGVNGQIMSKNKKTIFSGAATALITPFSDGRIDFDAFERIIDRQLSGGISALVIAGTTGESSTLSQKEQIALVRFAQDMASIPPPHGGRDRLYRLQ